MFVNICSGSYSRIILSDHSFRQPLCDYKLELSHRYSPKRDDSSCKRRPWATFHCINICRSVVDVSSLGIITVWSIRSLALCQIIEIYAIITTDKMEDICSCVAHPGGTTGNMLHSGYQTRESCLYSSDTLARRNIRAPASPLIHDRRSEIYVIAIIYSRYQEFIEQ